MGKFTKINKGGVWRLLDLHSLGFDDFSQFIHISKWSYVMFQVQQCMTVLSVQRRRRQEDVELYYP